MSLSNFEVLELFIEHCGGRLRLTPPPRSQLVVISERGEYLPVVPNIVEFQRSYASKLEVRLEQLPELIRNASDAVGASHDEYFPTPKEKRARFNILVAMRNTLQEEEERLKKHVHFLSSRAENTSHLSSIVRLAKTSGLVPHVEEKCIETEFFRTRLHLVAPFGPRLKYGPLLSKMIVRMAYEAECEKLCKEPVGPRTFRQKLLGWTEVAAVPISEYRVAGRRSWVGICHVGPRDSEYCRFPGKGTYCVDLAVDRLDANGTDPSPSPSPSEKGYPEDLDN